MPLKSQTVMQGEPPVREETPHLMQNLAKLKNGSAKISLKGS
jgi:hypothetical protein